MLHRIYIFIQFKIYLLKMDFGVGDVLTISGLAVKVYTAYRDAPDDYRHISEEVKSLQTIVDGAVKYFENTSLGDSKRQEGQEALQGCQGVLEDLNSLIEKYKSLASPNKMQFFTRVRLGIEDIVTLRARLTSNTVLLSNFIRRFVIQSLTSIQPTRVCFQNCHSAYIRHRVLTYSP